MPRAPKHNIVMYRGGSFDLSLTYQDSDGCAIDLSSGYTCHFTGKPTLSDPATIDFDSTSNPTKVVLSNSTPNITITLGPSDTNYAAETGVYDIKLVHSDSTVFLIEGEYEIVQPVS